MKKTLAGFRKKIKHGAMSLLHYGWRRRCPICEGNFREWLECGLVHRRKGKCPRCFSVERHRLIFLYLKNKTDFFRSPLKVLHVAPETCFIRSFRAMKNLEYQTADLDSPYADIKIDITDMKKIPDNAYDVVLCSHVLEHVQEDLKAMREIYRVLKPGGWAILQVPIAAGKMTHEDPAVVSPEERERLFGQKDHVRMYGEDYRKRLESAGFRVTKDAYVKTMDEKDRAQYGLDMTEDVYLCQKQAAL